MLKAFSRHKTESKPVGIYGVLLRSVSSFSQIYSRLTEFKSVVPRENLRDTRNIPCLDKYTSG